MRVYESFVGEPIDYSLQFTERVALLGTQLSSLMSSAPKHISDMNYSAGQALEWCYEGDGVRLQFWFSSRGPLWAAVEFVRQSNNAWSPSLQFDMRASARVAKAATLLLQAGWVFLDAHHHEPINNMVTELDGVPTTVFQHFFTEMF